MSRPNPREVAGITDEEIDSAFLFDRPLTDYSKRELAAVVVWFHKLRAQEARERVKLGPTPGGRLD